VKAGVCWYERRRIDMSRPAVLVLGIHSQTLAVMRSLHAAGYAVILGRGSGRCPEQFSNACESSWVHPSFAVPAFGPAFERFLQERPEITCVFPVGTDDALAVAATGPLDHRARDDSRAAPRVVVATVTPQLLRACHYKPDGNDLAAAAGLAVPRGVVVHSLAELEAAVASIGYPVVVKPVSSGTPLFGRKAWRLRSRAELAAAFGHWPLQRERLLVQAYVEGSLVACDYVAQNGRVVGYFETASVRADPADGTCHSVEYPSRPISPDVLAACRGFCRTTAYDGPGTLQFVRSGRDHRLYFMENDPRHSAGIAQAVRCGQDLPHLALRVGAARRTGEQLAEFRERDAYRVGVRTYALHRDPLQSGIRHARVPGRFRAGPEWRATAPGFHARASRPG
jgi:predicted ATP-grasp superfamily ATP-dependent carboligase